MTEEVKHVVECKFTKEDLMLILYWRNRCHEMPSTTTTICPLHCVKEGLDFCHNLSDELIQKLKVLTEIE